MEIHAFNNRSYFEINRGYYTVSRSRYEYNIENNLEVGTSYIYLYIALLVRSCIRRERLISCSVVDLI